MKQQTMKLLGVGVASLLIGGGAGYILAKKQLSEAFDQALDEQIRASESFYKKLYKAEGFETPEKAAETLDAEDKAVEAMRLYRRDLVDLGLPNKTDEASEADANRVLKNIFSEPQPRDLGPVTIDRGRPYRISEEDYFLNDPEYTQHTMTYYIEDGILADESDVSVDNANAMVGLSHLQDFGASEDTTVYIRNETLLADFEINKSTGSYSKEVMGL